MGVDGSIKIDTKIDQSGIKSGLAETDAACKKFAAGAGQTLSGITLDKNGRMRDEFGRFVAGAGQAQGATAGLTGSLGGLGGAGASVAGIFAGISIGAFGAAALKSTADIELAQVKLETLLGSASAAQSMINDIVKMADTTPYNSNDLIQAATTLKTFGITAKDMMPTLTALGNAAGGQAENLKGISMALGQTAAQGKMMTQDLYQFINAGVPLLDLLAKRLKKSTTEIKAMIEAGKIGYTEVNGALQEFYTGNGKYAGLMARAAMTLPGMFSTMQDAAMSFGRSLVSVFEPMIKSAIQTLTDVFTSLSNIIKNMTPQNKAYLQAAAQFVAVFIAVAGAVALATGAFRILFGVLAANPIGLVITLVGSLILALKRLERAATESSTLTTAENIKMAESVAALEKKYDDASKASGKFDPFNRDTANIVKKQLEIITEVNSEYEKNVNNLRNIKAGTDEWTKAVADISAEYAFLSKSTVKAGLTDEQNARIDKLREKFESLYKVRTKNAKLPDELTPKTGAAADQATIDKQKKLWQDYWAWKIGEVAGSLQKEIYISDMKYADEVKVAEGSLQLLTALEEQHNEEIRIIKEKWAEKHKLASFLMGLGMQEKTAEGMESGLHYIVHAVKDVAEAIAQTFAVMGAIFEGSVNLLDWFVDFDPKDMFDKFSEYLKKLGDFFENDLGSISIWFDQGVVILEKFLAGMLSNLPAITETLGNVITHIVDYFAKNGDKIIKQVLTIAVALLTTVIQSLPEIFKALFQGLVSFINTLVVLAPGLMDALFKAVSEMITYLGKNSDILVAAMVALLFVVIDGIIRNMPQILEALAEAYPIIATAIAVDLPIAIIKELPAIIKTLAVAMVKALPALVKGLSRGLYQAGKDIVYGLINGIFAAGDLWGRVKVIFTNFLSKIKGFFGIQSPSTVFYQIGVDIMTGLFNGIQVLVQTVVDIFSGMFEFLSALVDSFLSKTLGAFSFLRTGIINIFSGLTDIIKAPFNALIAGVNALIAALNTLHFSIPGWVPGVGGKSFGLNFGYLDYLAEGTEDARGGWTVVGENGPELMNMKPHATVKSTAASLAALASLNNFSASGASAGGGGLALSIGASDVVIDGDVVGRVVFRRIDKMIRNAYGV